MAETAPPTAQGPDCEDRDSPFQGLEYYTEADSKWFFGRTTDRKIITAHLRTARFTLLYAESGVGKSSLLRAGVEAWLRAAAMRSIGVRGYPKFVPIVFNDWKDDPIAALISEIEAQTEHYAEPVRLAGAFTPGTDPEGGEPPPLPELESVDDDLISGPAVPPAQSRLASAIGSASRTLGATLLIILDQFEEYFGYREGQPHPNDLVDQLAACIKSPAAQANFLIAVREDSYGGVGDLFGGRIGNVYSNYLHLEYLTREAARDAIEGPIRAYNKEYDESIELEPGLTKAVLDAVARGNLALEPGDEDGGRSNVTASGDDEIEAAFLQLVMDRVWKCEVENWEHEGQNAARVLRESTLNRQLRGAEQIVRSHLDRALAVLDDQELEMATDIFTELVTGSGAKMAYTSADLADKTRRHADKTRRRSEDDVAAVLHKLEGERIVRAVDAAPGDSKRRYEIFHDKLAVPIRDWRKKRESVRLAEEKRRAEQEARRQRDQARRFRRLARIAAALALVTALALIAAVVLWRYASDQSAAARKEATTSASLALSSEAQLNADNRPDVSLALALAGYRLRSRAAASGMMASLESFRRTGALAVLHGNEDTVNAVAFSPDGHTLASGGSDATIRMWSVHARRQIGLPLTTPDATGIVGVAFSPNGHVLASAGGFDRAVRLWNVQTHRQLGPKIQADGVYVYSVAFSPDGHTLASAGATNRVALWNVQTHDQLVPTLTCRCEKVTSVAFSPNGQLLATAGYDGAVRLWNVRTHRQLAAVPGSVGAIYAIAFSPDGRTLAYAGTRGTIGLLNVRTRSRSGSLLRDHAGPVTSLAFSAQDELASAGADGTIRLWNIHSHRKLGQPLTGHAGTVLGVSFSPDAQTLASAGTDGTIRLWGVHGQERLGNPLTGRAKYVSSVAVSPDGRTLASGSDDGKIRLWDTRTRAPRGRPLAVGHRRSITSLAFSVTDGTLVAGDAEGTISLWNIGEGARINVLHASNDTIDGVAASPDGRLLASADALGAVSVWDMRTPRRIVLPVGFVRTLAFSPNGEILATGSGKTIGLWDVQTYRRIGTLVGSKGQIDAVAFESNGILASAGSDKIIRLWSVLRESQLRVLTGSTGAILTLAFSPDNRTLASGGTDNAVRLWDPATGSQLGLALTGHSDPVNSLAFTPDGHTLFSGSGDGTVRTWSGIFWRNVADLEGQVCTIIGTGLSRTEWAQYVPGIPYQQSCPVDAFPAG